MKNKIFTLLFAMVASVGSLLAESVKVGDLYYDLDADAKTAKVLGSQSRTISMDWNNFPAAYVTEFICPDDAYHVGLKSAKVYADKSYIYIRVEIRFIL